MNLELRTLTPLWTGGVEAGKVDRIHETGILGSLRWWYEAIVRGLGGYACDPTQGSCKFDVDKYAKSKTINKHQRLHDAGLCNACKVFGATGWQRRFNLHIEEINISDALIQDKINVSPDRNYRDHNGEIRKPAWYFKDSSNKPATPKKGTFFININSLYTDFPPRIIGGLIQFVSDWATLGARAQMGFGVVEPLNGPIDTKLLYNWVIPLAGKNAYPSLPAIQDCFFARIKSKDKSTALNVKDTFNLKYDLRQLFAGQENKVLRHFIMGMADNSHKIAAKVKMSRPYGKEIIRVWGWIPEEADCYNHEWNRNTVISKIHEYLEKNYQLQIWREMKTVRDTVSPGTIDAKVFLQSLLGLEEYSDAT